MWGHVVGGVWLIAFLLFRVKADDSQDLKANNLITPEEDPRSGAYTEITYNGGDLPSFALPGGYGYSASSPGYSPLYSPGGGSSFSEAQTNAQTISGFPYSLGYGPLYSPGSGTSSALAEAQAQTISGGPGLTYSPSYSPLYSPGLGTSSALAEAQAQTISGGPGLTYSPSYSPLYSPGLGTSSALAEAQAQTISGGSGLTYSPSYSPLYSPGLGTSSSLAEAQAQTISGSPGLTYSPGYSPLYSPGLGTSSSLAEAQAQTISGSPGLTYSPGYSPLYSPGLSTSSVLTEAQSQVISGGPGLSYSSTLGEAQVPTSNAQNSWPYQPPTPGAGFISAQADSVAQVITGESVAQAGANANSFAFGGNVQSAAFANTLAGVNSRVIPQNEYIFPHQIPGAEQSIICSREGELHYLWSEAYACLVCACVSQFGYLKPVCANCAGCVSPQPAPEPVLPPLPPAPLPPPLPAPTPSIDNPVSCDPLPTNSPFQNPLNPCQICICRQSVSMYGKPDVQIVCEENPQCVLPPDHILPPIPIQPAPVPLPHCDRMPKNVWFPHPVDVCRLCKCILEPSESGLLQSQIICFPNPDCEIQPEPIPLQPITPEPMPLPIEPLLPPLPPIPSEPIPLPPITPEPLSPLVPIIPDILPPEPVPSAPRPLPHNVSPLPGVPPHESCRPYTPNQPFQHPWDVCQVCVCTEAVAIGLITIEVNCFTKPECCIEPPFPAVPGPVFPGGSSYSNAEAFASTNSGGLITSNSLRPSAYPLYLPNGGSQASAEAIAEVQTQQNGYRPIYPAKYPVPVPSAPGLANLIPTGSQSSVIAEAQANTANPSGLYPIGSYQRPGYSGSSASAEAETISQVNTGYYQRPGYTSGSTFAEAEAGANTGYNQQRPGNLLLGQSSASSAEAVTNTVNQQPSYGLLVDRPALAPSSAGQQSFAEAEAATSSIVQPASLTPSYLSPGWNQPGYVTSQSEAIAEAQTGLSGGGILSYAPRPSPGYLTGQVWGQSDLAQAQAQAQAKAQVQAQGLAQGATSAFNLAQAQALAAGFGRPMIIKSGNPDDAADY